MDDDDDLLSIEKDILGNVNMHESQNLPPPNKSTTAIVTNHGTYLNGFIPAKSPFQRVDATTIEIVQPTIVEQDIELVVQHKRRKTENYFSKDPPLSSPQRLISNTLTQTRSPQPPSFSQSKNQLNLSQISPILSTSSQSSSNTPISPHFQILSNTPSSLPLSSTATRPPQQQQYKQQQQQQQQRLQQITLSQNLSSTSIQDKSNKIIPGPAGTLLNYNNNSSSQSTVDINQSISNTTTTTATIINNNNNSSNNSNNDLSITASDINNSEMYLSSPLWNIVYKDLDITNNMSHYPIGVILKNDNTDTKIPELFGIITSITVKCTGTMINIKDTTGTIEGIIHKSLSDEINGQLSCGCIILLRNVSVLVTYLSNRYIIITKNNFVKLYIPNIQKTVNYTNANNTNIDSEDNNDNDSNSLFGGMFRIPT